MIKQVEEKAELVKEFRNASIVARLNEKWSFALDTNDVGRNGKWYAVNFDDSKWANVKATLWWEDQGYGGYDGPAWYRQKFTKPQVKANQKVILLLLRHLLLLNRTIPIV